MISLYKFDGDLVTILNVSTITDESYVEETRRVLCIRNTTRLMYTKHDASYVDETRRVLCRRNTMILM